MTVSDPAGRGSLTFGYNTNGLLASVTDWANRAVQYGYDSNGRLQTVTDRDGKQTTYAYDGTSSRLASITDANGHAAIGLTYDASGRVATQQDALGNQTSFAYVSNGDGTQTTTVTSPTTSYQPTFHPTTADTYDANGRLIKRVSQPSSTETDTETFGYDSNSNLISHTDARGNATQFCYDVDYSGTAIAGSQGNLTRTIAPAPTTGANVPVTLLKYDSKNNLVDTIAPKGVASGTSATCSTNFSGSVNTLYATDHTYDSNGVDLLSTTEHYTDPDLGQQTATTNYQYGDSANPGMVTAIIAPLGAGHTTTLTYYGSGSQAGLLASSTDGDGDKTTYSYDAVGRKTGMVDPDGNATGGSPAAHTWSWSYDGEDGLLTVSAPAPTTGGAPLTTQYQYDAVGNRTVVIDPSGQVTKDLYDARDQLSEVDQSPAAWTDPNATPNPKVATTYVYDHLGNLSRVTRAAGDSQNERATAYAYDGANRLRQETQYPAWPATSPTLVTSYGYDQDGNRTILVDPLNQTTTMGYDALNRLTSVAYSDGKTPNVAYTYDADGNRATMADGTGTTTYADDELGRPTSVVGPGSVTVGYRYDLDGNRTKTIYPDGTAVASAFDNADRQTGLTDWASRTTGYAYFPDGNLQTVTNVDGTTATYGEDNAQRLTQVSNQQGSNILDQHTYTLDALGDPTQRQETLAPVGGGQPVTTSTSYTYNALSQLTGEGTTGYGYDPVGNRTTVTVNGSQTAYSYDKADRVTGGGSIAYTVNANGDLTNRGGDGFVYDQANRLTSATVGGATTTYVYNGDGERISETIGGATTAYALDVNRSLPVVLSDGTRKYVHGPAGLAYNVDTANNVTVYHTDSLGSVRALTNGSGTLVQTSQTDAFGNVTSTQGTASQPFGYTGQQADSNGLVYLRARYYDPASGRFLSRDPVAGSTAAPLSLNRYSYALNDPMALVDPGGLTPGNKALAGDDTCNNPLGALYCAVVNPVVGPGGLLSMLPGLYHGQGEGGGGGNSFVSAPEQRRSSPAEHRLFGHWRPHDYRLRAEPAKRSDHRLGTLNPSMPNITDRVG